MAILTISDTAAFLSTHDRYTILTHRRPDGDTLGSAALLCRGLRKLGKTAHVLENPEITPKYAELTRELTKPAPEAGDILISVDVASPGMLQHNFAHLAEQITLRIDHHKNESSWTEHELVDHISAACGQIIYWVLLQLCIPLDIPMANALYTAVATDTGCFRYANAQAQTYETAAACARVTPYLRELNHTLFETNSLARLRMQGWMVENARFLHDGKVCLCPIPLEVEQRIGVTEDDMENISGFPRSIAGVKIAATLRQENEHKVKISLRVDLDYDASVICAKLGGGGHRGAAGASLEMSMEEAVNTLIAALPEME